VDGGGWWGGGDLGVVVGFVGWGVVGLGWGVVCFVGGRFGGGLWCGVLGGVGVFEDARKNRTESKTEVPAINFNGGRGGGGLSKKKS